VVGMLRGAGIAAAFVAALRAAMVLVLAFGGADLPATFTGLLGLCAVACTQGARTPHVALVCLVAGRCSCWADVIAL